MKRYLATFVFGSGLVVGLLAVACSKGDSSGGEVRAQLQAESMKAAAALSSYEVQADGEVRQGGSKAQFKLTYTFVAPDRAQWVNESTFGGTTDRAGLLIIGQQRWSFDGETWTEEPPLTRDIHNYTADKIWGLIPFSTAKAKGKVEDVNGFKAQRYQAERSGEGILIQLVGGSLLVTEETPFDGELTSFKMDYWTEATQGFPVQMKLVASGGDRSVTVNAKLVKANEASISLAPPPAFIARAGSTPATGTGAQPAATQPTTAAAAPASTSAPAPTSTSAPPAPTSTTAPPPPTSTSAPAVLAPTSTQAPQPTQAAQPTTAPPPPAPSPAATTGVAPATQEQPQAVSASANLPSSGSGGAIRGSNMNVAAFGLMMALAGLALLAVQADWWRPRRQAAHGVSAAALPPAHGPSSSSCSLREGAPNGPADAEIERLRQSLAALRAQLSRETALLRAARAIDRLRRP